MGLTILLREKYTPLRRLITIKVFMIFQNISEEDSIFQTELVELSYSS